MDRRSLLAIVLSTLVILVFNFYFMPKPAPEPAAPVADSLTAAAAPGGQAPPALSPPAPAVPAAGDSAAADSGAATLAAVAGQLHSAPNAEPVTLPLSIDGVDAVFTGQGGAIASWKLKKFPAPGGVVEMVLSAPEPKAILHIDDRAIDLNGVVYAGTAEPLPNGGQLVTFRAGVPGGLEVTKRYRLGADSPLYEIEMEVAGLPISARDTWLEVGWSGIPQAEPVAQTDHQAFGAVVAAGKDVQRVHAGSFRKERRKEVNGEIHWVAARNKYFMAALVPPKSQVTTAFTAGDAANHVAGASLRFPVTATGTFHQSMRLYLGPIDYWQLKKLGLGLEYAVDLGWKIILPVAQLLLWGLNIGYQLIPNYGVVIILLSALTRLLFYPLTQVSMRSMRAMQEIQPEMERLRKKWEKDPQRLNQEVFALYKKHNVNPVSGCLPLLLQMPVFFALYSVLANSVELRQAPFVGWITDLSAPDTLATVGGFAIHILPVLMSLTMFWQQKLTPTDPRQAPIMLIMPFMMLFFFYKVPSGLTLYWTVTNLLSVVQQWQMNRENKARAAMATT